MDKQFILSCKGATVVPVTTDTHTPTLSVISILQPAEMSPGLSLPTESFDHKHIYVRDRAGTSER